MFSQIYGQAEAPVTISTPGLADTRALAHEPELLTTAGWPYTGVEVAVATADGVDRADAARARS